MHNHLLPVLVLAVLPALYFGHRLGWHKVPWARRLGIAALLAAVAWSLPFQGLELVYVKRLNLLIAAAAAVLMLLTHCRVPWTRSRPRRLAVLAALATFAVVNYTNYFAFHGHGPRAFVHLHDVAHYYLGAKYYAETGYTDLYTAMLRAEAELTGDRFRAIEARDLETYERVHIRTLLERSGPVKAAFSPQRWSDFQRDVALFRDRLDGEQYGRVLLDHGFNPTPVWALVGGALANRVPAGSARGILLLTLLDPLLLAAAAAAIAWAFGLEAMLLTVLHFCVIFGATFGWTGGAYLRYLWFFAVVAALAALHRKRYLPAGSLLALATMLRVFPVFFLLPLAFKAAAVAVRRGAPRGSHKVLFASFATTATLLLALTTILPRGVRHWQEFRANMQHHVANISPNVIGLTEALALRPGAGEVTAAEFEALKERRQRIYRWHLAVLFLPALATTALLARRRTDLGAVALALPLLYLGLSLAAYYHVFLVLLILVHRRFPRRLALIFAVEAAPYALQLFEEREALIFVYRGVLLALLYLALELEQRWRRRTPG